MAVTCERMADSMTVIDERVTELIQILDGDRYNDWTAISEGKLWVLHNKMGQLIISYQNAKARCQRLMEADA